MCVLRASGTNTAVIEFLKDSSLEPCVIFDENHQSRKDKVPKTFGFNVTVSDAEFEDLNAQINDVTRFLHKEQQELRRLVQFADIEGVSVDFAISSPPDEIMVWTRSFPPELLGLLGALGIGLDFTIYPESQNEC